MPSPSAQKKKIEIHLSLNIHVLDVYIVNPFSAANSEVNYRSIPLLKLKYYCITLLIIKFGRFLSAIILSCLRKKETLFKYTSILTRTLESMKYFKFERTRHHFLKQAGQINQRIIIASGGGGWRERKRE
jgi:hypothetical protein